MEIFLSFKHKLTFRLKLARRPIAAVFTAALALLTSNIAQASEFRILTEHLPPYQIAKQNKLIGGKHFLFVEALLEQIPGEQKIELMPWARAYKTALEQKNIFLFSIVRSEAREEQFHWIAKLSNMDYGIFFNAKRDDIYISSLEDSLDYSAVAVRNSYEASLLVNYGFIPGENLHLANSVTEVWRMLSQNRVDFTIANTLVFEDVLASLKIPVENFEVIPDAQFAAPMYIAASLDTDSQIIAQIQQAYDRLIRENSYVHLIEH